MTTRTRVTLHQPQPHLGPLLSSYQDGTASAEEQDLVMHHLLECEICRDFLAQLQQVRELISELPGDSNRDEAEYRAVMSRTAYKNDLKHLSKAQKLWRKQRRKTPPASSSAEVKPHSTLQNAPQEEMINEKRP